MGSTCKYLGFSSNTTDQGEMQKVQDAIVSVKPHLKAFLNTNVGAGLVNGSTAMAMDWDYDVALLQQKNPKIKWVLPDEGVHAYLEGFTPVLNTSKLPVIQAFMNFLATPVQYADFVNTTGTAYLIEAATPLVAKTISQNPVLVPTPEVLAKVEFDHYLGGAGATLWSNTWTAIKAA
jgi:spermidine/putrescine-binding protein